jgi:hypothetical protein
MATQLLTLRTLIFAVSASFAIVFVKQMKGAKSKEIVVPQGRLIALPYLNKF